MARKCLLVAPTCTLGQPAALSGTSAGRMSQSLVSCSPRPSAAGLNPEPVRQGSELSGRINAVLRQLRSSKELWQVGLGGGGRRGQQLTGLRQGDVNERSHQGSQASSAVVWRNFLAAVASPRRLAGVLDDPARHAYGGARHALPGG